MRRSFRDLFAVAEYALAIHPGRLGCVSEDPQGFVCALPVYRGVYVALEGYLVIHKAVLGILVLGRPPFRPFSRAAAVFAADLARPPFLPRATACLFFMRVQGRLRSSCDTLRGLH